jgi:hypothetical protein
MLGGEGKSWRWRAWRDGFPRRSFRALTTTSNLYRFPIGFGRVCPTCGSFAVSNTVNRKIQEKRIDTMIIKRRTQFPLEEIVLPPEKTGLSAGYIAIPTPMRPAGHVRADGLTYVDVIHGRETDNATIGSFYTGVPALLELRSIAGEPEYPQWVEGQPASIRVYRTDFNGEWFAVSAAGEIIAASEDCELFPSLTDKARHWVSLNKTLIERYFFEGGTSGEDNPLNLLRHARSGKTRIDLAVEKFEERLHDLGENHGFNPWRGNLPKVENEEKLAALVTDVERIRAEIELGKEEGAILWIEFGTEGGRAQGGSYGEELFRHLISQEACFAMLNQWLVLGVREGFIQDSLEALDYVVDCDGKSTAIEKEIARRNEKPQA